MIITLITGIGIGTIVAAFIGWQVAISNHRQAWINALRDDLSEYLKKIEAMHYAIGDILHGPGNEEAEKHKQQTRLEVLHVYWRIVLRLNKNEDLHNTLKQKLEDLQMIHERVPNRTMINGAIDIAQQVLKREWEVAKLGPFSGFVMRYRDKNGK